MARRKNTKRIDPRYFLEETVNRDEKRLISTPPAPLAEEKKELVNLSNISEQRFQQILVEETIKALLEQDHDAGRWLGREIMAPGPGDPGYEPPDPRYTWKPAPEPPPAPEPVPPPRARWHRRGPKFPKPGPRGPLPGPDAGWKTRLAHQLGRGARYIMRHPAFAPALASYIGYEAGKRGQKYATHLIPGSPEYIKTGEQRIQAPPTRVVLDKYGKPEIDPDTEKPKTERIPAIHPLTGKPFPPGEDPAGGLWVDLDTTLATGVPKIYELPGRDPRYVPREWEDNMTDLLRDEYFKELRASERFDWVPPSGYPDHYTAEDPEDLDWWDQIPGLGSAKPESNVRKGVNWGVTDVDWSPRELARALLPGFYPAGARGKFDPEGPAARAGKELPDASDYAWDYDTGGSIIDWSPGKVAGSTFDAKNLQKRMVGGKHVPASKDPKYLAQRQAERVAGKSAEIKAAAAARKAKDREKKSKEFNKRYNIPDDSER